MLLERMFFFYDQIHFYLQLKGGLKIQLSGPGFACFSFFIKKRLKFTIKGGLLLQLKKEPKFRDKQCLDLQLKWGGSHIQVMGPGCTKRRPIFTVNGAWNKFAGVCK